MTLPACKFCNSPSESKSEKMIANNGLEIQVLQCPDCGLFDISITAPIGDTFAPFGPSGPSSKTISAIEIAMTLLKKT